MILSQVAIMAIFAAGGAAMFTRRLPSLLALPAMALAIALVALVRWDHHIPLIGHLGLAGFATGIWALARELLLVLAATVALAAVVWMICREAWVADPLIGRAVALLVPAAALAAALLTAGPLARPPFTLPRGPLAFLVLYGAVVTTLCWRALGGSDRRATRLDRAAAAFAGLGAALFASRVLAPFTTHWYYQGELAPVAESLRGLFADLDYILRGVVHEGALRLASNYVIIIFGSMLAAFLARTGLAREIVKTAAELGGDRPRVLAAVMLGVVAILFTSLAGLGSIIMVGLIVLPLLHSLEAQPEAAASLLLMGISIGGILNPANWNLYLEVFKIPRDQVLRFSVPLFAYGLVMALIFIWREFPAVPDEAVAGDAARSIPLGEAPLRRGPLARLRHAWDAMTTIQPGGLRPIMVVLPLLPLFFILGAGLPEVPSFVLTLLIGTALYAAPRRADLLVAVALEGLSGVAPAVVILMGLGMLLKALSLPVLGGPGATAAVPAIMAPVVSALVPATPVSYVVVFTLLSPLALYRGPLNVWGMGLGLAEVIRAAGSLGAPLVMGMLQSVGQVQGICDPTNTANIWIAGHARVTTRRILIKTLPYAVALASVGLVYSSKVFAPEFAGALHPR